MISSKMYTSCTLPSVMRIPASEITAFLPSSLTAMPAAAIPDNLPTLGNEDQKKG
jgi:hypothetical protein